ncbi:MAG: MFS transporter, partial [Gammaproteobacteria bacterium]
VTVFALDGLWIPAAICLCTIPFVARLLPPPAPRSTEWRIRLHGRLGATARLIGYVTLRNGAVMGATTYLPILWKHRGGGLIGGAGLVSLMLIVGVVGTMYGGHLADRLGRKRVLVAAGVAMAGGLALIAWGTPAALWAGAAFFGIPAFATFPLTTVSGQDLYPENRPFGSGLALGLGNALGTGLVAILGLGVGLFGLPGLFWILAAVGLLSAPMALWSEHRPSRPRV